MPPVQVLLIDHNKLFREGLKLLLNGEKFSITGEAQTVAEGVNLVQGGLKAELVLLDMAWNGDTEAETLRTLRDLLPDGRIVLLAADMDPQRLITALGAGADGCLMKDLSADALIQSLHLVMMGEKVFPTHLAALLISGRINTSAFDMPSARKGLSQREVQIVRCLLNGDSNKVVANHLNITEATVKVHLKSLLRKINATNRTQAAIWALNNGFANEPAHQSPHPQPQQPTKQAG
jgi:two-component system nitrate/nitrite response regulator NarL